MDNRRYLGLVILSLVLMFLPGCPKDPYGASVKAGADIAQGVSAGMKTVDQLRVSGVISPAEESNVLGYLEFVNKADGAFLSCANTVHKVKGTGSYTNCAQIFSTALSDPSTLALIHVNDPKASADITVIANGFVTGINSVITILGGA